MSDWQIRRQKTGFRLLRKGQQVGGWDCVRKHLFVLDRYVQAIPGARRVLEANGFELRETPVNHFWWRVSQDKFNVFAITVDELASLEPDTAG